MCSGRTSGVSRRAGIGLSTVPNKNASEMTSQSCWRHTTRALASQCALLQAAGTPSAGIDAMPCSSGAARHCLTPGTAARRLGSTLQLPLPLQARLPTWCGCKKQWSILRQKEAHGGPHFILRAADDYAATMHVLAFSSDRTLGMLRPPMRTSSMPWASVCMMKSSPVCMATNTASSSGTWAMPATEVGRPPEHLSAMLIAHSTCMLQMGDEWQTGSGCVHDCCTIPTGNDSQLETATYLAVRWW